MHQWIFFWSAGRLFSHSFCSNGLASGGRVNVGQGRHPAEDKGRGSARRGSQRVWRRVATSWLGVAALTLRDVLLQVLCRGPCSAPGFWARNPAPKCVPELLGPRFRSLFSGPESGLIFGPACGDRFAMRVQPPAVRLACLASSSRAARGRSCRRRFARKVWVGIWVRVVASDSRLATSACGRPREGSVAEKARLRCACHSASFGGFLVQARGQVSLRAWSSQPRRRGPVPGLSGFRARLLLKSVVAVRPFCGAVQHSGLGELVGFRGVVLVFRPGFGPTVRAVLASFE